MKKDSAALKHHWLHSACLAVLVATGCQPYKAGPPTAPVPRVDGARPADALAPLPTGASAPVGTVATGGAPIVGNNGGNLIGKVKAPAHLISDKGLGLISDKGLGVVSNGGGNYHLTAVVEQVPLAGAPVRVLDASGKVLAETVTGSDGGYGITATLPDRNLIVEVLLPANRGVVQAIAPRGAKQADADLVSTLTTGYITSQYVKTQDDPLAAFEKLPADVERETRARAQAALEGGTAPVPDALTTEQVVAAVEALRQQDATFHAQLETVKQLLVAAGQSNLGDGQRASQVILTSVRAVAAGPAGEVYVASRFDRRVWRIRPDGVIETAIGAGGAVTPALTGKKGREVGIAEPVDIAVDDSGRLWLLEAGRLSRLEPDGTLTEVATGLEKARRVLTPIAGQTYVLTEQYYDSEFKLWDVRPGQAPRYLRDLTFERGDSLYEIARSLDDGITLTVGSTVGNSGSRYYRYRPATGAMDALPLPAAPAWLRLGAHGELFTVDRERRLSVTTPKGETRTLGEVPADTPYSLEQAVLDSTGAGWVFMSNDTSSLGSFQAYSFKDGASKAVAGVPLGAADIVGTADTFPFWSPLGLAIAPSGEIYVSDNTKQRVYRIDTAKNVNVLAGAGTGVLKLNGLTAVIPVLVGVPALKAELLSPSHIRLDPVGRPVFHNAASPFGNSQLFRVGLDGRLESVYEPHYTHRISDFVYAPNGDLYVASGPFLGPFKVIRVAAGGRPEVVLSEHDQLHPSLALTPDGRVLINADGILYSWSEAEGRKPIHEDERFLSSLGGAPMAVDREGRVYLCNLPQNKILRFDLKSKGFSAVTGAGGVAFGGAGIDDSVDLPMTPTFDPAGNLYFSDVNHRQIKRIPADKLR